MIANPVTMNARWLGIGIADVPGGAGVTSGERIDQAIALVRLAITDALAEGLSAMRIGRITDAAEALEEARPFLPSPRHDVNRRESAA